MRISCFHILVLYVGNMNVSGFLTPVLLFLSICTFGQYPNQSYPANQVGQIISPQMSSIHLNQPSALGGNVFLAGNAVHEIWNISNPTNPIFISRMTSNHAAGEAESHQITYIKDAIGNYFFVTVSGRGIDIWNVTDPTNPIYVSALTLPGINYGDVSNAIWGLSAQGNYIYVGATNNGLYIIDATDKSNPIHVNTVPTSDMGGVFAGPLFAQGNLLIILTPKSHAGIVTMDISDSENPSLLDFWSSPDDSYIGNYYNGHGILIDPLRIFDVTSNPLDIKFVHSQNIPNSEYTSFDQEHMFLGGLRGGTQGIYKYDISNLSAPSQLLRIEGRDSRWDDQFSCPIGNIVIMTDDQNVNGYVGGVIGVHASQADTQSPEVTHVFPKPNSIGQALSSKIGLSFSDWIEFSSVNANTFELRPVGGIALDGTWGCTYTTLTFEPNQALQANTTYEIILQENGITDFVGNALTTTFISTFTTGDGTNSNFDSRPAEVTPVAVNTPTDWHILNARQEEKYEWETGDGNLLTGEIAAHTYSSPGRYAVTMSKYSMGQSVYEAEAGTLSGGVVIQSDHAGYSGSGYVDFPGNQGGDVYVQWDIQQSGPSNQSLIFQYALGSSTSRPLELSINGGQNQTVNFTPTGSWSSYNQKIVGGVQLQPGNNTIRLSATAGSTGPNIDYLGFDEGSVCVYLGSESFIQIVYETPTVNPPASNTQIVEDENDQIWLVNTDANTVTLVDKVERIKVGEIQVGHMPMALANAGNNKLWVVNKQESTISIIDKQLMSEVQKIYLPYASRPHSIVFNQNRNKAYVGLEATGKILEIDESTQQIVRSLPLSDTNGRSPQISGLALSADNNHLYSSRLISNGSYGEIYKIRLSDFVQESIIQLAESSGVDGPLFARGIPNYITDLTISPNGKTLWAASKKDNIRRGLLRDGLPLQHDNSVRAISSIIDVETNTELLSQRLDFDNSDRIHSISFSDLGDLVFLTKPGNNEVLVLDAFTNSELASIQTSEVPTYCYYDNTTARLYVKTFLGRSLEIFDVADISQGGTNYYKITEINTVSNELLTPEILAGKKLFYDASSTKLNLDGYMSCASCHLDGGHDGTVWDLSNLGEGLRNTIDLRGRSGMGHGRLHWTGNFDEVHDFENQIRSLGSGLGLLSDSDFMTGSRSEPLGDPKAGLSAELDALAAYVASLTEVPDSPFKNNDGSMTESALRGQSVFFQLGCGTCHNGPNFTNSNEGYRFDVGTLNLLSGQRLGSSILGLDVPTLKGVWATAPYLHDGSAQTLEEVLTLKNSNDKHGLISSLTNEQRADLISFLMQIDEDTPSSSVADLTLDIIEINEGDLFSTCESVLIGISHNLLNPLSMEVYSNGILLGIHEPFSEEFIWDDTTEGIHQIEVKVYYGNQEQAIVSNCVAIEIFDDSIDEDVDGVCDHKDNCVSIFNPDQIDTDNDGIGDSCDTCIHLHDELIGQMCEDGDPCTIGEIYDNNCMCAGGISTDSDNDSVCDELDVCPNANDAIIGTPCDDGDFCTTGETYDSQCNCSGGVFQDADNDGICDAEDNNCNPISISDFETGSGIWQSNGHDAEWLMSPDSPSGNYSFRIRDNSGLASSFSSAVLDLSSESLTKISFSFKTKSLSVGEDFFLEISANGGSSFLLHSRWIMGTDFENDQIYQKEIYVNKNVLSEITVIRFRCDGSINQDEVFIDNIKIDQCPQCESNLIETNNELITASRYTELYIETNGIIESGNIDYTAGEYILMNPGFEVKSAAVFHAYYLSCSPQ